MLAQDGGHTQELPLLDYNYGNHSLVTLVVHVERLLAPGVRVSVFRVLARVWDCTLGSGESEGTESLRSRPYASNYDDTDL